MLCERWDALPSWEWYKPIECISGNQAPLLEPNTEHESSLQRQSSSAAACAALDEWSPGLYSGWPSNYFTSRSRLPGLLDTLKDCACRHGYRCAHVDTLNGQCACPALAEGFVERWRDLVPNPFASDAEQDRLDSAAQDAFNKKKELKEAGGRSRPGPAALLHSDAERREFISAGAAAGLAVSFFLHCPNTLLKHCACSCTCIHTH